MYPLREKDCLSRVVIYDLTRDFEQFRIEILVILSGGGDHRCEALLYHEENLSDDQLFGYGQTEQSALRDLLRKIQGYSADELFSFFENP